ncbi:MAG: 16S rRNA (guanine(966)-N(2))-methyltransferase RsmD [Actinomycetota bacterium]|nr:16S rRNA (guanine(966)-N(2))-methyltransferase RsmD [Actinomycetota bacterium]
MRVVAGSAKGTRLAPVPAGTRPLSDRAREGLFSSLGPALAGARVLDLYAGTGAMGIEALSRGATSAVFVDSAPAAVKTIAENLRRTRLSGKGEVRRQDAVRALRQKLGQFDLVLADPPYRLASRDVDALVTELASSGAVAPQGRVVLTRRRASYMPVIPVDWHLAKQLNYGDALVLVFQAP